MSKQVRALTRQQQLFLQRLLSSHVLSDAEAQSLWDELSTLPGTHPSQHQGDGGQGLGRNLRHTLKVINGSLTRGFGLEIRSASLALRPSRHDDHHDTPRPAKDAKEREVLYHCIVNQTGDDMARVAACPSSIKTPHELALFRQVLEHLIESSSSSSSSAEEQSPSNDNDNDESSPSKRQKRNRTRLGMGCTSSISWMDAINLRTRLAGPHAEKLSIEQTERALLALESEGWLASALPPSSRKEDEEDDDDDDEDGDGKGMPRRTPSRRSGGGGGGGGLVRANHLQIGPRTYMELSDMLADMGLDRAALPQLLLN